MTKEWFRAKEAAAYSGVSSRTLRGWLAKGLRHSRVSRGTVLIKREWIDEYLGNFEHQTHRVNEIVEDVLSKMTGRRGSCQRSGGQGQ
ncbi:MAG: excisionase family DNA-binding protein [Deltaproteobacteria bacterium]|nr:excisionase family DNA-binding protein [Deltaproteobacteria bacterium]